MMIDIFCQSWPLHFLASEATASLDASAGCVIFMRICVLSATSDNTGDVWISAKPPRRWRWRDFQHSLRRQRASEVGCFLSPLMLTAGGGAFRVGQWMPPDAMIADTPSPPRPHTIDAARHVIRPLLFQNLTWRRARHVGRRHFQYHSWCAYLGACATITLVISRPLFGKRPRVGHVERY